MRKVALLLMAVFFIPGCASMAATSAPPPELNRVERDEPVARPAQTQPTRPRHFDDGGPITEAPLEPAEMRIQRAGSITVSCSGKEIKASREIRRAAMKFDGMVMGFKDDEVSLKLASNKLDAFIDFLDNQDSLEVKAYDFSAFDRTLEHYSLAERLERAQLVHDQLKELLKKAASLNELERIEQKLAESQKTLDALKTTKLDIDLRAGRVDLRVIIK
ncbi:MAG: hypothetical protein BroJett014_00480 [Planctomycetota bacterium]|nr:hypothetical protein [Planctomycetota bacterium]GIK51075.1 MAG: hypothetical protein BroJett014_00480 [Planctomycetota bacterium]